MMEIIITYAPIAGLLFFFTTFTLTALWLVRPGAKAFYQSCSEIPLKETR